MSPINRFPIAGKKKKPRLTREEKARRTKHLLFEAAAEVVGEIGYALASISEITKRAGVAQGTFYNYFDSREELFDQLLPALGDDLLEHVAKFVKHAGDPISVEEQGFRGFFDYLSRNPGFLKILNEAETLAPEAYHSHFENVAGKYVKSLRRSKRHGYLAEYADDELETLAYIFMAARPYLAMRFARANNRITEVPESVLKTYMKFVRFGLGATTRLPKVSNDNMPYDAKTVESAPKPRRARISVARN